MDQTLMKDVQIETMKIFFDALLFTAPQDTEENNTRKSLTGATRDPCTAVDVSNEGAKIRLEVKAVSEQKKLQENPYECTLPESLSDEQSNPSLRNQPPSNAFRANVECAPLENVGLADVADNMENLQTDCELSGEKVEDASKGDKETIAIEMEADIIQNERWIQGEEDLMLPISEETGEIVGQEQDQEVINRENDDERTRETTGKKGNSHPLTTADGKTSKDSKRQRGISSCKRRCNIHNRFIKEKKEESEEEEKEKEKRDNKNRYHWRYFLYKKKS